MRHNLEHKSARKRRALSADAVLRGGQAKQAAPAAAEVSLGLTGTNKTLES